jgi:hypothetical protein
MFWAHLAASQRADLVNLPTSSLEACQAIDCTPAGVSGTSAGAATIKGFAAVSIHEFNATNCRTYWDGSALRMVVGVDQYDVIEECHVSESTISNCWGTSASLCMKRNSTWERVNFIDNACLAFRVEILDSSVTLRECCFFGEYSDSFIGSGPDLSDAKPTFVLENCWFSADPNSYMYWTIEGDIQITSTLVALLPLACVTWIPTPTPAFTDAHWAYSIRRTILRLSFFTFVL